MPKNDWDEYKKLVLYAMKEHGERLDKMIVVLSEIQQDMTRLKTKAAIMGGATGLICTALLDVLFHKWK